MVMKKNAMRKNLRQSILKSFGRYIAIVMIIALGAGLFVGLLMTKADMVATGQRFMDEQNMFDLRMVSNYGWTEEYVDAFSQFEGVTGAEGLIYMDFIARVGDAQEDSVYRLYSLPESMNRLALRGGRWPEAPNECLADGFFWRDSILGKTLVISETNEEDSLDALKQETFTVVGYVASPLYMDMNRGTTSVGSGSLENYFYIPKEAYNVSYFTEINLTIDVPGKIYTAEYNDAVDAFVDEIKPEAEALSATRFHDVKMEAEEGYKAGYQEFESGVAEYMAGKAQANRQLHDARKKLEDGDRALASSKQQLINAGNQIADGRAEILAGQLQLQAAEQELISGREEAEKLFSVAQAALDALYKTTKPAYDAAQQEIQEAQAEADRVAQEIGVSQIKAEISALESQIDAKRAERSAIDAQIEELRNAEIPDLLAILELEQKKSALDLEILSLNGDIAAKKADLAPYELALANVEAKKAQHAVTLETMNGLEKGYAELDAKRAELETQLAEGAAQIEENKKKLKDAEKKLNTAYAQMIEGWEQYYDGEKELEEGWKAFEEGELEARQELADAWTELTEAEQDLLEARKEIDDMDEPDLIMLDRGSNVGYNNLDSSSDIVQGVSRVFPVFSCWWRRWFASPP